MARESEDRKKVPAVKVTVNTAQGCGGSIAGVLAGDSAWQLQAKQQ